MSREAKSGRFSVGNVSYKDKNISDTCKLPLGNKYSWVDVDRQPSPVLPTIFTASLDGFHLNVDVVDVSGGEVRVEVIKAPRTFATPHVFAEKNQFPATFSVEEDVVLMKISKDSFFKMMHSMPVLLHNFLCVSTSCNKCTMTRLRVLSFRGIRSR